MSSTASATTATATPSRLRRRPRALDDPEVQERILRGIRLGLFLGVAVRAAGISRQTFYFWKARWEAGDPETDSLASFFKCQVMEEAKAESRALAVIRNAVDDHSWRAPAWWLSRRHPERWGLARLRRAALPAIPDDLTRLTDEQLDELEARL